VNYGKEKQMKIIKFDEDNAVYSDCISSIQYKKDFDGYKEVVMVFPKSDRLGNMFPQLYIPGTEAMAQKFIRKWMEAEENEKETESKKDS
jgi:hypothetical protein